MNTDDDSQVRMFFALLPEAATRASVEQAAEGLPFGAGNRRVPLVDHHVTLAFVGNLPVAQLPVLRQIGAAQRGDAFLLRFDAYEYWPKPEVVVAAARSIPPALRSLWECLHQALAARQWALDPKRLRPHVTLARKVAQEPVLPTLRPFDWPANAFSLMRSDVGAFGPSYTVVDTWPLLDDSAKT